MSDMALCASTKAVEINFEKIAIRKSWTDTYTGRWSGPPTVYRKNRGDIFSREKIGQPVCHLVLITRAIGRDKIVLVEAISPAM